MIITSALWTVALVLEIGLPKIMIRNNLFWSAPQSTLLKLLFCFPILQRMTVKQENSHWRWKNLTWQELTNRSMWQPTTDQSQVMIRPTQKLSFKGNTLVLFYYFDSSRRWSPPREHVRKKKWTQKLIEWNLKVLDNFITWKV